ncbi:TPA: terminase small subunit, partial [Providencia rettgeri]|nr:terminase small subunit [Providencia rettgeri]
CREYLVDLNATQAAIRAGYSDKTARSQANRMLTNVDIEKRIQELMNNRSDRLDVDADYVLKRLVDIDQMDVLDILHDDGGIKPIHEWPKVWRTSLSGIDLAEMFESKDGERDLVGIMKKIKWPDKVKNLELLGKHIKVQAFKEQIEQKVEATHNIMPVPSCDNVDDWEKAAQQQQGEVLGG